MSDAIAEMKFHRGGGVFCFDDVPIRRLVKEYNQFRKLRDQHYKFLAAINGRKFM